MTNTSTVKNAAVKDRSLTKNEIMLKIISKSATEDFTGFMLTCPQDVKKELLGITFTAKDLFGDGSLNFVKSLTDRTGKNGEVFSPMQMDFRFMFMRTLMCDKLLNMIHSRIDEGISPAKFEEAFEHMNGLSASPCEIRALLRKYLKA